MMNKQKLTIVLTLKGRPLHTLRWLWYANRIRLPFHVIVADGEVDPKLAEFLENTENFPNLSYEYHRYSDLTRIDYYNKLADALRKVETPYIKMSDNDDFLFVTGLKRNVDFLEMDPEYVAAQGGIAGFCMSQKKGAFDKVTGKIIETEKRYGPTYNSKDLDHNDPIERTIDEIQDYHSIYYAVYRTDTLRIIVNEIVDNGFSSSHIYERFWAYRTVSLGKVRSDTSCLSYFRQYGTSLRSTNKEDYIVNMLIGDNYSEDFRSMIKVLSKSLAENSEVPIDVIEEKLRNAFAEYLRAWLITQFSKPSSLRYLSKIIPRIERLIKRYILPVERNLFQDFKGKDKEDLKLHYKEFKEVKNILGSNEFEKFVKRNFSSFCKT